MGFERMGFLQSIKDTLSEAAEASRTAQTETLFSGSASSGTQLTIYRDGSFATSSSAWGTKS